MLRALPGRLRIVASSTAINLIPQSQSASGLSQVARRCWTTLPSSRARNPLFGAYLAGSSSRGLLRPSTPIILAPAAAAWMPGGSGLASAFGSILVNGLHSWSNPPSAAQLWQQLCAMGLLGWLAVDLGINWIGWAAAAALKTEVFYDLLGSASFLTLTAGSLLAGPGGAVAGGARKLLAGCMVGLWALRLGSHLASRIARSGRDSRFDGVRDNPPRFLVYWTMQAGWVFVTLLPVLLLNAASRSVPLGAADAAGVLLYGTGLLVEAVADHQKSGWRSRPDNAGRFIDSGLWSLSRHPNYWGEMVVWCGVYLTCAPGLPSLPQRLVALLSPLAVAALLRFVSGVPLLEAAAEARWGGSAEYQAYKARTHLLLPLPTWGWGKKDT